MTRLAQVIFGVLVAAAFGAFFVAQELKSSPSVVQSFQLKYRAISPNGDLRLDVQRVTFRLKHTDTVDVAVVDDADDPVRTIASGIRLRRYRQLKPSLVWGGRDARGRIVPDGLYRIRITLRGEGRTVIMRRAFRVDTTPPNVRIISVGPSVAPDPEVLPRRDQAPARIRFDLPAFHGRLRIYRLRPAPVALVARKSIPDGEHLVTWMGRGPGGRRLAPGTYLAVIVTRDRAGNDGSSIALGADGLPDPAALTPLPRRGVIELRRRSVR
ncbi:unannotated protein [freshwater metagenome]|uniref:Unannotated protein n=1 Tax=freshwater metagenome TaxID=449393 RepID=A0A6J7HB25_9ZZZZ|nr:hypothetical protein [Actinomycetota bacterium]